MSKINRSIYKIIVLNHCILILLLLLFLGAKTLLAQSKQEEYSLNDSIFFIGQVYRFDPIFLHTTAPLGQDAILEIMHPIKKFLQSNPELVIEIGAHTNTRGDSLFNKEIAEERALMVYRHLISFGVDSCRIYWRGYGADKPIISHEIIQSLENIRDREAAHRINRRVELKIIAIIKQ